MDSDLGDSDGGKRVWNMLIDSAWAFRWVIFHYTSLHRVVVGAHHIHKHTRTHRHTQTYSTPSTNLREIRPKTSAAAAPLLKYEWF